jgi:peptidyl-prolyl cis-trans isomerase B (cyclophilin B)
MMQAIMETNKGTIRLELFTDQVPYTVANFANLAQRGYYNGLTFHRVIADFMVQAGCPLGTGTGGPGYTIDDEVMPGILHDGPGVLSMAKTAQPNTGGSQFFITHRATPHLDGVHTVFGKVVGPEDQAVVDAIVQGDSMTSVTIDGDLAGLLAQTQDKVSEWNAVLDEKFPAK